jgi:hypothetical protein
LNWNGTQNDCSNRLLLVFISCFKEESNEPENAIPDDCLVKASKINGKIIDNAYGLLKVS